MQDLFSLDPTASLVENGEPNAQLIPNVDALGQPTGKPKVRFLGDEKARLDTYLGQQLDKAIEWYTPIWSKRARNIEAYEGISDKGETITIPLSRSQTNQQHAWLMDRVYSADSLITVKPLGNSKFQIVVTDPVSGVATTKQITGTQCAEDIQSLVDYKWRIRLPMRKVLSDWAMEALTDGTCPAVVKIVHDKREMALTQRAEPQIAIDPETNQPRINGDGRQIQIIDSPEYRTIVDGDSVQIINVPGEDFMLPPGETDLQRAPWATMRTQPSSSDVRKKISSGEWDFCLDEPTDVDVNAVLFGLSDVNDSPSKRGKKAVSKIDKRTLDPTQGHTVYEVFFRWPFATPEDPSTITWHECVGYYHHKARKLMSCGLLDTWNGKRQFIDFFMRQRPNSYSGTCTVEDTAPFQRYASNLFHLQVQNKVMANISVIMVRKGTSAATFLSKKSNIKPGMVLQLDEMDDVVMKPLGTPFDGTANEIAFLVQGAEKMSLVTQYDTASADLSRVTAGAFSQQQDLSKMQPKQVYATFAERISSLALMYVQTLIQHAPEQTIPKFDDEQDAVINYVFQLPREMVTDQLQFSVTATAEDESPEARAQKDVVLGQQILGANNFNMSVLGQVMVPGCPPEFLQLGAFMIARNEMIVADMFKTAKKHNLEQFIMTPDMIMSAFTSLESRMMAMQTGAPNELQDAGAGGDVSAGPGGQQGLPDVQQEQGIQGVGPAPPGGNLPS